MQATPDGTSPKSAVKSGSQLDDSFVRGLAWTGIGRWGGQVISWLSTLVVIRLLTPEDYGIMGMATLYLGLIQLLSEFGIGAAVVTLRDLSRNQIAQLNSFALGFGLIGFLISAAVAIPLGAFFAAPDLPPVVVVVGAGFIITSLGVVPASLLLRDMRYKWISLMGAMQAIAGSVSTVILALMGFGYWALAFGNLIGLAAYSGLAVVSRAHSFAFPRPSAIQPAIRYSGHIIVSRLSWYAYSHADFLVVGRILGQAALGVYSVGWTLATLVVDKVSAIVMKVTPPLFAATQDDYPALRRYLLRITEGLALITFPAAFGLGLVADDFVVVFLGDGWGEVVRVLELLAYYGVVRSVTPLIPQVLNVTGDSRYPMINGMAAALLLPLGFWVGTRWGITGVATTWIIGYPLILFPLYRRLFWRINLTASEYLRALWPAVSSSAVMTAGVLATDWMLRGMLVPIQLAGQVMVGAGAYAAVVLLLHRSRVDVFRETLQSARRAEAKRKADRTAQAAPVPTEVVPQPVAETVTR